MWYVYVDESTSTRLWLIGLVKHDGVMHPQFSTLGRPMGIRSFDFALSIRDELCDMGYNARITAERPGR